MRWVTYAAGPGGSRVGLVNEGTVYGLDLGVTMLDLLSEPDGLAIAGDRAMASPDDVVAFDEIVLRTPLRPRSIRDHVGFLQHMRNCIQGSIDRRFSQVPTFYFSNTAALISPGEDVPISPGSQKFDYELEVCAVIGRMGFNIAREAAENHIAGYMILCDWSARDLQLNDMAMGLGPCKGKDGATSLGPMLVTPDELEPYRDTKGFDLGMRAYVNDELVSDGRWNSIDWDFADMITYAARGTSLLPGDVIGTGTVATGCLFEHYALKPDDFRGWLQPGDDVRLVVDELGTLAHRIVPGSAPQPLSTGY